MQKKQFSVYIMMNTWNTTSYLGVTGNLAERVWHHQQKLVAGFTKQYNLTKLVYHETFDEPTAAIAREKQLKKWSRMKKVNLIKRQNPEFRDLSKDWEA